MMLLVGSMLFFGDYNICGPTMRDERRGDKDDHTLVG
jgi:hypothetical protein